jgi:hypothetical protein
MTTHLYRTSPSAATPERTEDVPMYHDLSAQPPNNDAHRHPHHAHGSPVVAPPRPAVEPSAPTEPSRAVFLDIGEHTGALVLTASQERQGLEVEIHPVSDPSQRTHVWVLPREGRNGTVYAAVFPSLNIGDYAVLEPDGSVATTVAIAPNHVTNADWGCATASYGTADLR